MGPSEKSAPCALKHEPSSEINLSLTPHTEILSIIPGLCCPISQYFQTQGNCYSNNVGGDS
jgi:hypothetical protein